eukprot:s475_g19.t1
MRHLRTLPEDGIGILGWRSTVAVVALEALELSGIYRETRTATQLVDLERQRQLHAVKVIGWGAETGREFWIIENSFGKDWGEKGYAKIELSKGREGILLSEFAFAGTPVNPKVGLKLQSEQ